MQCKSCGAKLEPEMELCPECGMKIDKERKVSSSKGVKAVKIVMAVVAVLALLCGMILVIFKDVLIPGHWFSTLPGTIPEDGYANNVTCQGTYTDSVFALKWKKDTVVAKAGNMTLTNGLLQVFYDMTKSSFIQNNSSNLSSVNLDLSKPLDRQTCGLDESLTWQQYFLQSALEQWQLYALLCQQAAEAGFKLSDAEQKDLDDLYNQFYKYYVTTGKFSSVDAVIQDRAGLGCDFGNYQTYSELQMLASMYYNKLLGEYEVTEELIDAYYQEHQELLEKNNIKKEDGNILVDVRHILITVKQATSKEEHIEERDWQACQKMAQDVLDEWLAGEATEESFAKLAEKFSSDPGSNTAGGLYTGVQKGEMIDTFDAWCFDASRKAGDYGLVRTDYGYHIMYFSGSEAYWHGVCKAEVPHWQLGLQMDADIEALDTQTYYEKISLWEAAYNK